jgi:Ca-activated chloride channel family protein
MPTGVIWWRQRAVGYGCIVLEWAHPWALAALPLPLLAWWLLPPQHERTSAIRVPFFDAVAAAAGSEAREGAVVLRRRWFQIVSATLVWMLLVVGLAGPEWVGEPVLKTEVSRDVMLAIDLSGSMDTRDFPGETGDRVSRFEAVQRVVDRFVAARDADRIGLTVFGTKAYLQLPFTRDLQTARSLVDLMEVGIAGPQTALGDSIGLAIRSFESSDVDDRVLILLTDGNDTASRMTPVNAADIAARNGIEIYTIGIGDPEATGEDRVDFDVLSRIAQRTGGQFFTADDETALDAVYRRIDEISVAEVQTEAWRPRKSLVHWPAGAAVSIVLLAYVVLMVTGSRGRWA